MKLGGGPETAWQQRVDVSVGDRVTGGAVSTGGRLVVEARTVGSGTLPDDPASNSVATAADSRRTRPIVERIARMLGHITYLSRESMMQKFDAHRLQPRVDRPIPGRRAQRDDAAGG